MPLWLLPFGGLCARRAGAVRFFVFMGVTAAAGAAGASGSPTNTTVAMTSAPPRRFRARWRRQFDLHSYGAVFMSELNRGDAQAAAPGASTNPWRGRCVTGACVGLPCRVVWNQHHLRRRINCDRHRWRQRGTGSPLLAAFWPGLLLFFVCLIRISRARRLVLQMRPRKIIPIDPLIIVACRSARFTIHHLVNSGALAKARGRGFEAATAKPRPRPSNRRSTVV